MITNPHSVKQIKLQELGQGDIHSFCLYFLYEWLYQYVQTHIITYFLYDNNNFLKSSNSKCEQIYCNQGQHAGKPQGETLISGLKRKGIILRALMWAVTSLWPQKYFVEVKSIRREQNWCWFLTRPETCFEGRRPCVPFKTARLHPGSWINRLCQQSLHVMIYVEKASYWERVIWWYFARIKCGNIVPGCLWIVFSVPRTWLIVWFPEVMTGRFQVRRGARAIKILCTSQKKNASWVFSWSDFVLANRFWAQER